MAARPPRARIATHGHSKEPRLGRSLALLLGGRLCASATLAQPLISEQGEKTLRVVRVESPPMIDGLLNDAVWQNAEVVTDFHQIRPGDGTPPTQPTELYVLYDDDAMYIGARMHDDEPGLIAAP